MPHPTLAQALATAQLRGVARLDAQILLLHALGRAPHDRAWLIAHDAERLPESVGGRFEALARRRAAGEPLAYLTGTREFFGLQLQVDARVLDPRPDTETLVDWALCLLPRPQDAGRSQGQPRLEILDLGTGSGAIALALQHTRPDVQVTAVDVSPEALDLARHNALRLNLPVRFIEGSWFDPVIDQYLMIVANPPYIATGDPHLAALSHEPLRALESGPDGLDDLRRIIGRAPAHLLPGGWLLLEHGWDQAASVRRLLGQAGFAAVQSRRDLADIERCTGGRWLESVKPCPRPAQPRAGPTTRATR